MLVIVQTERERDIEWLGLFIAGILPICEGLLVGLINSIRFENSIKLHFWVTKTVLLLHLNQWSS